jgi:hypothetical protein
MAIRRPSISSPEWLFQDKLYLKEGNTELRYILVKRDGVIFTRQSQSYDYSNPPYADDEQRGGPIVARIDYTIEGLLITIDSWEVNWRDEWPLRLAVNYLTRCLYPSERNFVCRVGKENYAFWVSEQFGPTNNQNSNAVFMGEEDDFRLIPEPDWLYYPPPSYDNLEFMLSLPSELTG